MKIRRAASVPLILHDPFFSIWSSADCLYDKDPVHWCGARQKMRGYLKVGDKRYTFLGDKETDEVLQQKNIDVTATATEYIFENDEVTLKCRFTSPLLPNDMLLVSRPCTYIDLEVNKKNLSNVVVDFEVSADLVRQNQEIVRGFDGEHDGFAYSGMGRLIQQPLAGSFDKTTINWGYVYVASQEKDAKICFDTHNERIHLSIPMKDKKHVCFILAYDDLLSINYFGQWRKAYWTGIYSTILDAISAAFTDKEETLKKATELDQDIEKKAMEIGGEAYAFLCNMSFRQTVAAHKLITDEDGEVVFLSKENDSNGCIGTVDVSYPSIPLFMIYDTEYVKGMLRPIFKFAACDVWENDYAPHDVGRYPYAWGQVYGWKEAYGDDMDENERWRHQNPAVFPPFYMFPAGSNIYDPQWDMPVEECGNMLIMTAVICIADGDADFAKPYWNFLKKWKNYLIEYGADPGNQLCTDDFAGCLAHNVNLSLKAIMGIKAYAILADMLGEKAEAERYHALAKEMAVDWEVRAKAGDHYTLVFGSAKTWSLKYNLVWDKMWGSNLFSDEVYEKELSCYVQKAYEYGTPLDSRETYTKSDWILWCAAMSNDKEQTKRLIEPVAKYLENSESRVPFSDWYYTDTGLYRRFIARSVQGGIFMPMFMQVSKNKKR